MKNESTKRELSDVLYEFALTEGALSPEVLKTFVLRYPEYGESLSALALELALSVGETIHLEPADLSSSEVMRAMSFFENAQFEVENAQPSVDPFKDLSRSEFVEVVKSLNVNRQFLAKLRDRRIVPATIKARFRHRAAEALGVPVEAFSAYIGAAAQIHESVHHKADNRPKAPPQENFEEAARSAGLSEDQLKSLLED